MEEIWQFSQRLLLLSQEQRKSTSRSGEDDMKLSRAQSQVQP